MSLHDSFHFNRGSIENRSISPHFIVDKCSLTAKQPKFFSSRRYMLRKPLSIRKSDLQLDDKKDVKSLCKFVSTQLQNSTTCQTETKGLKRKIFSSSTSIKGSFLTQDNIHHDVDEKINLSEVGERLLQSVVSRRNLLINIPKQIKHSSRLPLTSTIITDIDCPINKSEKDLGDPIDSSSLPKPVFTVKSSFLEIINKTDCDSNKDLILSKPTLDTETFNKPSPNNNCAASEQDHPRSIEDVPTDANQIHKKIELQSETRARRSDRQDSKILICCLNRVASPEKYIKHLENAKSERTIGNDLKTNLRFKPIDQNAPVHSMRLTAPQTNVQLGYFPSSLKSILKKPISSDIKINKRVSFKQFKDTVSQNKAKR